MASREPDRVVIETDRGVFDRFQRAELVHDLFDTATASFEIGDDGTWRELERIVAPGEPFRVYLHPGGRDRRLLMTGRAEVNEVPCDAQGGTVVQLTCRTKMADARYASADPKTRFTKTTIKDFLLALYAPLGYGPKDFYFSDVGDADLVTGVTKGGKKPAAPLEPIKADQLKVNPPETIFEAANRILKRHHALHYDGADGSIVVGAPDGNAPPRYRFRCKRGAAAAGNNILKAKRTKDWSEAAGEVWVFGGGATKDVTRAAVAGVSVDLDLAVVAAARGHFVRKVLIPAEGTSTRDLADAQARRERMARAKRKDAWEIDVDGWTYWDGSDSVPLYINVVADVDVETVGGSATGHYVVTRVARHLSADEGALSSLTLVAPDVLEI